MKQHFSIQNDITEDHLRDSQTNETFPYYVKYDSLRIRVDKDVFSPKYFYGWQIFTENFPAFKNKTILEIGTATGITALYLAKNGAKHVTAVDINKKAIKNAADNAVANKITNIDIKYSDIFSNIPNNKRFDIIYWNMPFGCLSENYEKSITLLEKSIYDPGYKLLKRYLDEAHQYLAPNGIVLIGTGSGANLRLFKSIVKQFPYKIERLCKVDSMEVFPVDFQLFGLTL